MATCPKCQGEMDTFAQVCPHCGYDFPLGDPSIKSLLPPRENSSFAYSTFASVVLAFGLGLAWVGVVLTSIGVLVLSARQEWGAAFGALFSLFGCLIQAIVLQRVIDLSKD